MRTLKVGVVGGGFIGLRHIEAIRRIPHVRIVAVADTNVANATLAAEMAGDATTIYKTAEDMLAQEELDSVHNCTPTFLHQAINKLVISKGKHLYCEKPLSLNTAEADSLVEDLQRTNIANAVNFNYRMNAMTQELRERLCSGVSGYPLMVFGSYMQDWMLYKDDYDWRLDLQVGGRSRAIADIGTHLFDLSQYVMNKRIVAVNAHLIIAHPERLHYEKLGGTFSQKKGKLIETATVQNEDAAYIMVRFEDGTNGFFQVSQISAGHKNDFSIRVDLSQASYEWRQEDSDKLYIGKRGAPNEILYREADAMSEATRQYSTLPSGHLEGWNDALCTSIRAFYRSILDNTYANTGMPYATVVDGAWVMKVIEACMTSSNQRCWVSVETGERI